MEVVIQYEGSSQVSISKVGFFTVMGMVKDAMSGALGSKPVHTITIKPEIAATLEGDPAPVDQDRRKPQSSDLRDKLASMRKRLRVDDERTLDRVIELLSQHDREELS